MYPQINILYGLFNEEIPNLKIIYNLLSVEGIEDFIHIEGLRQMTLNYLNLNKQFTPEQNNAIKKRLIQLIKQLHVDEEVVKVNDFLSKNNDYICETFTYNSNLYSNILYKDETPLQGSFLLPSFPTNTITSNYGEYLFIPESKSPFIYKVVFVRKTEIKNPSGYPILINKANIIRDIFLITSFFADDSQLEEISNDQITYHYTLDMSFLFRSIQNKYYNILSSRGDENTVDSITTIENDNNIIVDPGRFSALIRPSISSFHIENFDKIKLYDYEIHVPDSEIKKLNELLMLFTGNKIPLKHINSAIYKTPFTESFITLQKISKKNFNEQKIREFFEVFFMTRYLIEDILEKYIYEGKIFVFDGVNQTDEKKYNLSVNFIGERSTNATQIKFKYGGIEVNEHAKLEIERSNPILNSKGDINFVHNSICSPFFFIKSVPISNTNPKQYESKTLVAYRHFPFLTNNNEISSLKTNFKVSRSKEFVSNNIIDVNFIRYKSNIETQNSTKMLHFLLKGKGDIINVGQNYVTELKEDLNIMSFVKLGGEKIEKIEQIFRSKGFNITLLGDKISSSSSIKLPSQTFLVKIIPYNKKTISISSVYYLSIDLMNGNFSNDFIKYNKIDDLIKLIDDYDGYVEIDDNFCNKIDQLINENDEFTNYVFNILFKNVKDPIYYTYTQELNEIIINSIEELFSKSIANIETYLNKNKARPNTYSFSSLEEKMFKSLNLIYPLTESNININISSLKSGIFLNDKTKTIGILNTFIDMPLNKVAEKIIKYEYYDSIINLICRSFNEESSYESEIVENLKPYIEKYQISQLSHYEYILSTTSNFEFSSINLLTKSFYPIIITPITNTTTISNSKEYKFITEDDFNNLYYKLYDRFEIINPTEGKMTNYILELFNTKFFEYSSLSIRNVDFVLYNKYEKNICYLPKVHLGNKLTYIKNENVTYISNLFILNFSGSAKSTGNLFLNETGSKKITDKIYNQMTLFINNLLKSYNDYFSSDSKVYCYSIKKTGDIYNISFIIPYKFLLAPFEDLQFEDFTFYIEDGFTEDIKNIINGIEQTISSNLTFDDIYDSLLYKPSSFPKEEKLLIENETSVSILNCPDVFDQLKIHNVYTSLIINDDNDDFTIDDIEFNDKISKIEYNNLKEDLLSYNKQYQQFTLNSKFTISIDNINWSNKHISDLFFTQSDKPLWKSWSSNGKYLVLGYKNGIKFYSIIDDNIIFIGNYEHIDVCKIIFGDNGYFITIQEIDNSLPYAILWNIMSNEKIRYFSFTDIRIGDKVKGLIARGNELVEEKIIVSSIENKKYYNSSNILIESPTSLKDNNVFSFSKNSLYLACNGRAYNESLEKNNIMFNIYNTQGDIVYNTQIPMQSFSWSPIKNELITVGQKSPPNISLFTSEFLTKSRKAKSNNILLQNENSISFKINFPDNNFYDQSTRLINSSQIENDPYITKLATNYTSGIWLYNLFLVYLNGELNVYDRTVDQRQSYYIEEFDPLFLIIIENNGIVQTLRYKALFLYPFNASEEDIIFYPIIDSIYYNWVDNKLFMWYYKMSSDGNEETIIKIYTKEEQKTITIYNSYFVLPSYNYITLFRNNIYEKIELEQIYHKNFYNYEYPVNITTTFKTEKFIYTNPIHSQTNTLYPISSYLVDDIKEDIPVVSFSFSDIKKFIDPSIYTNNNLVFISTEDKVYILPKTVKVKDMSSLNNQYDEYIETFSNFKAKLEQLLILREELKVLEKNLDFLKIDIKSSSNKMKSSLNKSEEHIYHLHEYNKFSEKYEIELSEYEILLSEYEVLSNEYEYKNEIDKYNKYLDEFYVRFNNVLEKIKLLENSIILLKESNEFYIPKIKSLNYNQDEDLIKQYNITIKNNNESITKKSIEIEELENIFDMMDCVNAKIEHNSFSKEYIVTRLNKIQKFLSKRGSIDIYEKYIEADVNVIVLDFNIKSNKMNINMISNGENGDFDVQLSKISINNISNDENGDIVFSFQNKLTELLPSDKYKPLTYTFTYTSTLKLSSLINNTKYSTIFNSPVKSTLKGFVDSNNKFIKVFYETNKIDKNITYQISNKIPLFATISESKSNINILPDVIKFDGKLYIIKWTNVFKQKDNGYIYNDNKIGVLMIYNLLNNEDVLIISPSNEHCDPVSKEDWNKNFYGEYENVWIENAENNPTVHYKYVGSSVNHEISFLSLTDTTNIGTENVKQELKNQHGVKSSKKISYTIYPFVHCTFPSSKDQQSWNVSDFNVVWSPSGNYFCVWYLFNNEDKYYGTSISIYSTNFILVFEKKLLMYKASSILLDYVKEINDDSTLYYNKLIIAGVGQGFPDKEVRIGKFNYLKKDNKTPIYLWENKKVVNCFDEEKLAPSRKVKELKFFKIVNGISYFAIYTDDKEESFLRIEGINEDKLITLKSNPIDITLSKGSAYCSVIYKNKTEIWNLLGELIDTIQGHASFKV